MQTAIGDPLARALLAGEIRDGQTVEVDAAEDRSGLVIRAGGAEPAADRPAAVAADA